MQSRKISLVEVCLSTFVGFLAGFMIGHVSRFLIFPLCGIEDGDSSYLQIFAIIAVISIVRFYDFGRVFNGWRRQAAPEMCSLCGSSGHTAALCPWGWLCSLIAGLAIAAIVASIAYGAGLLFGIDGSCKLIFAWTCFFIFLAVYFLFQWIARKPL